MAGNDAKTNLKEHYGEVAQMAADAGCDCCEPLAGSEAGNLYDPSLLDGLPIQAVAASRGCGDPVSQARLKPGERVLDLGSGGGVDALIASRMVGPQGHVCGLDMTPQMVELAQRNAREAGMDNVDFIEGDIANVPLPDACVDVVISNCVINLCEDKHAVFREARRVLAPGGRMVVSDIVSFEPVPQGAYDALCQITGCRNGITSRTAYQEMLAECGFEDASIEVKTLYTDDVLAEKAQRKGHTDVLSQALECGGGSTTGSAIVCARVVN